MSSVLPPRLAAMLKTDMDMILRREGTLRGHLRERVCQDSDGKWFVRTAANLYPPPEMGRTTLYTPPTRARQYWIRWAGGSPTRLSPVAVDVAPTTAATATAPASAPLRCETAPPSSVDQSFLEEHGTGPPAPSLPLPPSL
jgi:hypothetical protein